MINMTFIIQSLHTCKMLLLHVLLIYMRSPQGIKTSHEIFANIHIYLL
jgi:hypothetical protein